jgi:hypothetical protein
MTCRENESRRCGVRRRWGIVEKRTKQHPIPTLWRQLLMKTRLSDDDVPDNLIDLESNPPSLLLSTLCLRIAGSTQRRLKCSHLNAFALKEEILRLLGCHDRIIICEPASHLSDVKV